VFSKLRRTAAVLSIPTERPEYEGITRVPEYHEILRDREKAAGIPPPRPSNPVLRFLEIMLVALVAAFIVQPLVHLLMTPQNKASSIVMGVSTLAIYAIWEQVNQSLHGAIGRIVRLDFLDPYVGNRLKRTIQVLRS